MKARRHALILRIIQEQVIHTQEQLTRELQRAGIRVTQSTISRDIKELGLVKEPVEGGIYRYCLPREKPPNDIHDRLKKAFSDHVIGVDYSSNLVVVKTTPGTAQGVAAAIDELDWPEIVGTVAGDDAIIVVVRDDEQAECRNENVIRVAQRFTALRSGN